MTNLTVSLDEAIVRGARIRAIQEGTSVSAKVREFLSQYVEGAATPSTPEVQLRQAATQRLMDSIAKAAQASTASATETAKADGTTLRSTLYADNSCQKTPAASGTNPV